MLECVVTQWRLLAVELGFDVVVVEVLAVDGVSLGGKEAAAGLGRQDWASAAVLCLNQKLRCQFISNIFITKLEKKHAQIRHKDTKYDVDKYH